MKNNTENKKTEDELIFVIQVTRHGARSTIYDIEEPEINTEPWQHGIGALTPSGERQHYLVGRKYRN